MPELWWQFGKAADQAGDDVGKVPAGDIVSSMIVNIRRIR